MRLRALAVFVGLVPALAHAQPYTFVTTPASDSLAVIDVSSNTVVATLPLGGLPAGCAVGPHGTRLYAVLSQSNALAMIDMASGSLQSIPVGTHPAGVAVGAGGRRVYVANTGADTVSVVDPVRAAVVATLTVGDSPFAVVAGGQRVYVANWGGGTVSVIDTATDTVAATIPVGRFPAGLAFHRGSRRLYVANFFDDTVSVINTATLAVVSTIPVARRPRSLAVSADGQRLFVAGFEDGRVQAIDTRTGTVALDAASGGLNPLDLMLGPDGTRLYVAHLQETQGVVVLDAGTLAPVTSVNVAAGPVAFAGLSPARPPVSLGSRWARAARTLFDRPPSPPTQTAGGDKPPTQTAGGDKPPTQTAGGDKPVSASLEVRAPSLGDEVVISDTEFSLVNWAVSGGGEHTTTQETSGGNPGAWRRTTHIGPANTTHLLVRPGSTYNPASQGAIDRIDVSWDRRILAETLVSERFVVEQDNVFYRTVERTFFSPAWQTDSRMGLLADAFDDGAGAHPDFSEAGGPVRFGYVRQTSFSQTVPHGIDNFTVTVHQSPGNAAGRFGFQRTTEVVLETDTPFVFVDRLDGALGAVSVDVTTQRPDGGSTVETLSWPDGDNTARSILVLFLTLPDGSGARTARLTLGNATGGATIEETRESMAIIVFPEEWPPVLQALFLRLQGLLGAFSPLWLLVLAAPAALVARRERKRAKACPPQ